MSAADANARADKAEAALAEMTARLFDDDGLLAQAARDRDAARALADELAHWGAELAHLAVGLKTGRDLDRAIAEWEKAVAKWKASR